MTITGELACKSAVHLANHSLNLLNTYEASQGVLLLVMRIGRGLVHALKHTHCFFGIIMLLVSLTHSQFKLITNIDHPCLRLLFRILQG